jgi:N-acyl-D-amino-acid deacylase
LFDILIRGGRIIDGAGNPWFYADVCIENGKIAKVGSSDSADADRIIDVSGLVVCPGFIDIHSHSDWPLLINPRAESKIRQGVTLEVIGNCGSSAAPLKGKALDMAERTAKDHGTELRWSSMAEYLALLERQGVALNVASLIGQGTVRASVMGYEKRAPTKEELEQMKTLVSQSMKEGSFGMSTGLVYPPSCYAETDELIELSKVVAKHGGFYASHLRSQNELMFDSVKEAIEIGEKAMLPVQISHEIPAPPIWGQQEKLLKMSDEARQKGIDVACDVLVYLRGETNLKQLVPDWAHSGGDEKLLERLKDPEIREKIKKETMEKGAAAGGSAKRALIQLGLWNKIWLSECSINVDLCGKNFAEIAKLRNVTDPFDAVFDILIEENAAGSIMGEDKLQVDIDYALNHSTSMVGSDGSALAPYGVLGRGRANPRSYGTFSKVLARYVRERSVIPLESAIRKMTSFPAQRLGLHDRGLLKPGTWADIVIFDQDRIIDKATYESPYQYPEGNSYVLVNGKLVIENGEHTGVLPGKVLRKSLVYGSLNVEGKD